MKLKKFITSLLAVSMVAASAVSVSAAFDFEKDAESGMVFIYELPTQADVKARSPKLDVVVEKLDNATMSSVDAVYNNKYGKMKDENGAYKYDLYRVKYTISDIGDLALGYLENGDGLGVAAFVTEATLSAEDQEKVVASKSKVVPTGLSAGFGFDGNVLTFQAYTTELANPYPYFGDEELGEIVENATLEANALFVLNAGDSITLKLSPKTVNYILIDNCVSYQVPVNYTLVKDTLKLGEDTVVEDKPVTMDTPVAGNDMYGMKTALTEITFKNVADPVVKLEKDGVDSGKTYELPAGVKGGETAIIGIIRYAADVTGTFVLKVLDGTTEVASTTYVAE